MIDLDQLSLTDSNDPRTRVVIDLLTRLVFNEGQIVDVLTAARLNPGHYLPDKACVVWPAAVPDAAQVGRLTALVTRASGEAPALAGELDRQLSGLLGPLANGTWYACGDIFRSLLVGPAARRVMVDRVNLRGGLRELAADDYQILVINGDSPSGKSHTWVMLQHLRDTKKLMGTNRFAWVTVQEWTSPVTGEDLALSLADKLELGLTITPSGEMDDTRIRKLLDLYVGRWPLDGRVRWMMLDGLDRPTATESARDFAKGLTQRVLNGELPGARLVITGLAREGLAGGSRVRYEDIPTIDEQILETFLGEVADHLGRTPGPLEIPGMVQEIMCDSDGKRRDLAALEEQAYIVLRREWGPKP